MRLDDLTYCQQQLYLKLFISKLCYVSLQLINLEKKSNYVNFDCIIKYQKSLRKKRKTLR
jgi:hypothetical protein